MALAPTVRSLFADTGQQKKVEKSIHLYKCLQASLSTKIIPLQYRFTQAVTNGCAGFRPSLASLPQAANSDAKRKHDGEQLLQTSAAAAVVPNKNQ